MNETLQATQQMEERLSAFIEEHEALPAPTTDAASTSASPSLNEQLPADAVAIVRFVQHQVAPLFFLFASSFPKWRHHVWILVESDRSKLRKTAKENDITLVALEQPKEKALESLDHQTIALY